MTTKELIKQLKMIEKKNKPIYWEKEKEIIVKIWTIENGRVKEKELVLQNIMESNYDGKTTVILYI